MARTVDGLPENPDSGDELVRALEDSGYPVDGAEEPFIRQPDDPFVATDGTIATPVGLGTVRKRCTVSGEDRATGGGDVAEQPKTGDDGCSPLAIPGK